MSMEVSLSESRTFALKARIVFDPPLIVTKTTTSSKSRWDGSRRVYDNIERVSTQAVVGVDYGTTYNVLEAKDTLYTGSGRAYGYNILKSGEKGAPVRWAYGFSNRDGVLSDADEARWNEAKASVEGEFWAAIRAGLKERGL